MASTIITPKVTKGISNRKLVMEQCPKCQGSTAFEFDSDTSYYISCLNCGYVKNIQGRFLQPNRQYERPE